MADLLQSLKEYRCQHIVDEDGDGMPLVDVLTPQGDSDISRGLEELELLADYIEGSLRDSNWKLREAATKGKSNG